MLVSATAPGKLVLLGEYAVLEGAPALVMAVNRRAQVTLHDGADGLYELHARSIGVDVARFRFAADAKVDWLDTDAADAERLALAADVVAATIREADAPGLRVELDTDAFFARSDDSSTTRMKFGFGSSAALTVALAGALRAASGRAAPSFDNLVGMHRHVQGGRGSGVDIAASLRGGLLSYGLAASQPKAEPMRWPPALRTCCVWSGKSASTAAFLARVDAWREREPRAYAASMAELTACAETGIAALQAGNIPSLLETIGSYFDALAELGRASGADIASAEHAKIASTAKRCGVAYKSCGAGGGDIGIALSDDAQRLQAFRAQVEADGFRPIDLALDATGLLVN